MNGSESKWTQSQMNTETNGMYAFFVCDPFLIRIVHPVGRSNRQVNSGKSSTIYHQMDHFMIWWECGRKHVNNTFLFDFSKILCFHLSLHIFQLIETFDTHISNRKLFLFILALWFFSPYHTYLVYFKSENNIPRPIITKYSQINFYNNNGKKKYI